MKNEVFSFKKDSTLEKEDIGDMCQENKNLLNIYRSIYEKLADGGIIYGRPERIERLKEDISNG